MPDFIQNQEHRRPVMSMSRDAFLAASLNPKTPAELQQAYAFTDSPLARAMKDMQFYNSLEVAAIEEEIFQTVTRMLQDENAEKMSSLEANLRAQLYDDKVRMQLELTAAHTEISKRIAKASEGSDITDSLHKLSSSIADLQTKLDTLKKQKSDLIEKKAELGKEWDALQDKKKTELTTALRDKEFVNAQGEKTTLIPEVAEAIAVAQVAPSVDKLLKVNTALGAGLLKDTGEVVESQAKAIASVMTHMQAAMGALRALRFLADVEEATPKNLIFVANKNKPGVLHEIINNHNTYTPKTVQSIKETLIVHVQNRAVDRDIDRTEKELQVAQERLAHAKGKDADHNHRNTPRMK